MEQKSQIALSIEEMQALQRQGIDTSDASMCWVREPNSRHRHLVLHDEYCYEMGCLDPVPTYTLEDILLKFNGSIEFFVFSTEKGKEEVWEYSFWIKNKKRGKKGFGNTPLEAAFNGILALNIEQPDILKQVRKINSRR